MLGGFHCESFMNLSQVVWSVRSKEKHEVRDEHRNTFLREAILEENGKGTS